MTKLMIATPAYGEVFYAPYVRSLLALPRLSLKEKWDYTFESISYAEISEARNYLLTRFFDKTDATHLLFIDADMGFPAKLVSDMLAFGKPLTGTIYPKRQIDLERVAELSRKDPDKRRAVAKAHQFVVRHLSPVPPAQKGFIEVEACGAGVLLIERTCIAEMLRRIPELDDKSGKGRTPLTKELPRLIRAFDPIWLPDGGRLSEDYAFCYRWRHVCGGQIWANIAHTITHVGLHHFEARYEGSRPQVPRVVINPQEAKQLAHAVAISRLTAGGNGKGRKPVKALVRVVKKNKT